MISNKQYAVVLAIVLLATAGAGCSIGPSRSAGGGGGSGGGSGSSGTVLGNSGNTGAGTGTTTTTAASTYLVYVPDRNNVTQGSNSPGIGDGGLVTTGTNTLQIRPNSATLSGVTTVPDTGIMNLTGSANGVRTYSNGGSSAVLYTSVANGFGGTQNLTDASFGVFSTAYNTSELIAGGFHMGTATPMANVPTTGTATYRGTFAGFAYTEGAAANASALLGNATVTANFGANTVGGQISNLNRNGVATGVNLDFNSTLVGGSYFGTVTGVTSAATGAPVATIASSNVNGTFYGTNAAETAANVAVRTTTNPGLTGGAGTSGVVVVGAYGARR